MSCGVSRYGTKSVYTAPVSSSSGTSKLRVVHNIAGGPDVDGYLDGVNVLQNFSYKSITDYLKVKSGDRNITVKIAKTSNSVIDATINLLPGVTYTLIVHGLISNPKSISPLLLIDDLNCPAKGKAHVRFIHAAAGAPAVDVYANGKKSFGNVAYGQVGNPTYLPVNKGLVNAEVAAAGENISVLGPIPLELGDKGIYTVIASGLLNDQRFPLTALVSEDTKGSCVVVNI